MQIHSEPGNDSLCVAGLRSAHQSFSVSPVDNCRPDMSVTGKWQTLGNGTLTSCAPTSTTAFACDRSVKMAEFSGLQQIWRSGGTTDEGSRGLMKK